MSSCKAGLTICDRGQEAMKGVKCGKSLAISLTLLVIAVQLAEAQFSVLATEYTQLLIMANF